MTAIGVTILSNRGPLLTCHSDSGMVVVFVIFPLGLVNFREAKQVSRIQNRHKLAWWLLICTTQIGELGISKTEKLTVVAPLI